MRKAKPDIYTSDGRIDANKAFKLVQEKMMAMTNDEFRKVVEMPVPMRGSDGSILKATSVTSSVGAQELGGRFVKSTSASSKAVGPTAKKKAAPSGQAKSTARQGLPAVAARKPKPKRG